MQFEKQCFNFKNCGQLIYADDTPVLVPGAVITPKLNGPWLCRLCRSDEATFKAARRAMIEKFGWNKMYEGKFKNPKRAKKMEVFDAS